MTPVPLADSRPFERMVPATWAALLALALGWFWLATLVTAFGPVQQLVHFYEMGTVLRDPSWLVHGMGSHRIEAFVCGVFSGAVLLTPVYAHRVGTRAAWLLYLLPLVLMLLCGGILYSKTSQPYVTAGASSGVFGAFAAHVANEVLGRGADTIAKHISVGIGGYVSLAAALFLAFTGVKQYAAYQPTAAPSFLKSEPPR
jgi:hypothetical protein